MTSLRIERWLAAPPEQVWQAMTDPVALARWFWPSEYAATVSTEPRVGGRYRIDASARPGGGIAVGGEYREVQPPQRLVFTWRWDDPDAEPTSVVDLDLVADHDGTTLILVHDGLPDESSRADHLLGWSDCLDRLPAALAQPPARP